ncbi:hypothetical protein DIPPA_25356 [Diplonema papillatum]|nr:hypothetical protein DIPPA_25356 [Diplonema papillatum]
MLQSVVAQRPRRRGAVAARSGLQLPRRALVDEHTADLATARGGEAVEGLPDPPAPSAAGTVPRDATR